MAFRASRQALSQEVDLPRFREAFVRILPTLREWPAPAEILDLLPPRPPQKQITTDPEMTAEERAEGVRLLREFQLLASDLSETKAINHDHHNERARAEAHKRAQGG
jgi:hypothetical protein